MDEQSHNLILALQAKIDELTEALALTNEKMNKFIEHESTLAYDDGRLWMKLGIKKIEDMSKEELLLLNEAVANRQIGKRIKSEEALARPTDEESLKLYDDQKDLGYDEALVSTAKNLVSRWIDQVKEDEVSRTEA